MDTNFIIVIIALAAVILIVFLVIRNRRDEKEFENQLKEDYRKPDQRHDTDVGENERI